MLDEHHNRSTELGTLLRSTDLGSIHFTDHGLGNVIPDFMEDRHMKIYAAERMTNLSAANGSLLTQGVNLTAILGPRRQELYKVIPVTIVYCVIFVTGVIGNIITCLVVAKNKYMQTATNIYLLNLAVSDLFMLLLGLPLEMYSFWSAYPWIFGNVFCVVRTMAAETSTYASILTITAFTAERYVAICHPMKASQPATCSSIGTSSPPVKRAIRAIVLIWLVSAICAIPMVLQFGVVYVKNAKGQNIAESASCNLIKERVLKHTFEVSTFLFFLAPMTVISVLYGLIGLAVRRSTLARTGSDASQHRNTELRHLQQSRARKAVLKMLVAVVVAFFICWAPFHTQRLMALYLKKEQWTETVTKIQHVLFYTSGILYYVSSTINPILYSIMSLKFRQAVKNTLCRSCQRHSATERSSTPRPHNRQRTTYKFHNKRSGSKPTPGTNLTLLNGYPEAYRKRQLPPACCYNEAGSSSLSNQPLNAAPPGCGGGAMKHEFIELQQVLVDCKSCTLNRSHSGHSLVYNVSKPYHSCT